MAVALGADRDHEEGCPSLRHCQWTLLPERAESSANQPVDAKTAIISHRGTLLLKRGIPSYVDPTPKGSIRFPHWQITGSIGPPGGERRHNSPQFPG